MDTLAKASDSLQQLPNPVSLILNNNNLDYCLMIWIIIITGVIGGLINYLSADSRSTEQYPQHFLRDRKLYMHLSMGLCGSTLIPMFLYTTSSSLFTPNNTSELLYFVFAGYCLLGSIFAKAILNTLATRIFNLEQQVQTQQSQTENIKQELLNAQTEPVKTNEVQVSAIAQQITATGNVTTDMLNDNAADLIRVLTDMQNSRYKNRTVTGISKTTHIPEANISDILQGFVKSGLAETQDLNDNTYYSLTPLGATTTLVSA